MRYFLIFNLSISLIFSLFFLSCAHRAPQTPPSVSETKVVVAPLKLTPFEQNGAFGYQDPQGNMVIPPKYKMAHDFNSSGIAAVLDEKGWTYINDKGENLVRPFYFDNGPDYFIEGLARFEANGKMGFFDESGQIVIPAKFDFVGPFSAGLARFCMGCQIRPMKGGDSHDNHTELVGGHWGIINSQGKNVLNPVYDSIESIEGNKVHLIKEGKKLMIQIPQSEIEAEGEGEGEDESY